MKAIVIKNLNGKIEIDNNIPKPNNLTPDELLIENEGSQINPADLNILTRTYKDYLNKGHKYFTAGMEGVGKVIKVGNESLNHYLGKRVAYASLGGTWAQYTKANFMTTLIIEDDMIKANEWPSFANPLTAMCMLDIAKRKESKCVVQTGAASTCGKMFIKLCKANGRSTINIIRNKAYVDELKSLGADYVLLQDDPDFKAKFRKLVVELKPRVCFECVSGTFGGLVFNLMPQRSTMYLYGSLSLQPLGGISPEEMIYKEKDIKHLTLFPYMMLKLRDRLDEFLTDAKKFYKECFGITIAKEFAFSEVESAIEYYKENSSKGKVILRPKF
jgi:trans-2-enoyl-CoA reductase